MIADAEVARNLHARAVGYERKVEHEIVVGDELKLVTRTVHYPPNVQACIFRLRHRRRWTWRDGQVDPSILAFDGTAQPMVRGLGRTMVQKDNLEANAHAMTGGKVVKTTMLLGVFVGCALALTGCHYSEEQLWQECCILVVHTDETSSSESRIAILELNATTFFTGEGRGGLSTDVSRRQKQKIERQLDGFLDGHPGQRPSDYFAGLGMACKSLSDSKAGLAQCEADLPIWARCDKMRFMPFGHVPVPKELEQPIPAVLHVSISLSGARVLDLGSRVFAIPGRRLCHR